MQSRYAHVKHALDTRPHSASDKRGFFRDRPTRAVVPVHYRRPAAGHIQLSIDAGSEPSLVFVSEAHHPWWRVSVDGVS